MTKSAAFIGLLPAVIAMMMMIPCLTTAWIVAPASSLRRNRFRLAAATDDDGIVEHNRPVSFSKTSGANTAEEWWNKQDESVLQDVNVRAKVPSRRLRLRYDRETEKYGRGKRFLSSPPRESGYYKDGKVFLPDGHFLGYDELYLADQEHDMIFYLNNLSDQKQNDKSSQVFQYCQEKGYNFLTYDWLSRGTSSGRLREGTLTRWRDDTIWMLDTFMTHVKGGRLGLKSVLVGAGVGAWVACLVALERPDLVRGIVGISADPDFTEDLLWKQLPQEDKDAIMEEGFREVKWGDRDEVYPITRELIVDAREKHLILRGGKDSLDIYCPVRLIHSLDDEEVPVTVPMRLLDCIRGSDGQLYFSKVGGHSVQTSTRGSQWVNPNVQISKIWVNPNSVNFFRDSLKQSLNEIFRATERDTLGEDLW